jgi:hypothetical protein
VPALLLAFAAAPNGPTHMITTIPRRSDKRDGARRPAKLRHLLAIPPSARSIPPPMGDHFKTLGVGAGSTGDEIKAAFRKLALEYHPDRSAARMLHGVLGRARSLMQRRRERSSRSGPLQLHPAPDRGPSRRHAHSSAGEREAAAARFKVLALPASRSAPGCRHWRPMAPLGCSAGPAVQHHTRAPAPTHSLLSLQAITEAYEVLGDGARLCRRPSAAAPLLPPPACSLAAQVPARGLPTANPCCCLRRAPALRVRGHHQGRGLGGLPLPQRQVRRGAGSAPYPFAHQPQQAHAGSWRHPAGSASGGRSCSPA